MRFGYCLNMVATRPDGVGGEWIETAAKAGFDYVELPLAQVMQLDTQALAALKKQLARCSIPCESCNNFFPVDMRLTGPGTDLEGALAYAQAALATAAGLGAAVVVFGSGPAKNVPEGFSKAQGLEQVACLLRGVGPLAQKWGITIAIEPLRKAECNIVNSFAEGCLLAEKVGHPNVKVLVDYYHLTVEAEPLENLRRGRQWLGHVHFANPAGRVSPALADGHDYGAFARCLGEIGYTRRVSGEAYADDFAQAAPLAWQFFDTVFSTSGRLTK